MTTKLTKEQIKERSKQLGKKSWESENTDKSRLRFQRMQALSVLSRKRNRAEKLSTVKVGKVADGKL